MPPSAMRPLAGLNCEKIRLVAFDIDDTLTTRGKLRSSTLEALWRMSDAGLKLIALTGRPASWGQAFAQQWPVDAVVTENGAVGFIAGHAVLEYGSPPQHAEPPSPAPQHEVLQWLSEQHPDLKLASDQPARWMDVAVDVRERQHLPTERIQHLHASARARGLVTTESSIHVHLQQAAWSKGLALTRYMHDASCRSDETLFVGDSPNDESCFALACHTVGVANVTQHQLAHHPQWITQGSAGAGFEELAAAVLRAKTGPLR